MKHIVTENGVIINCNAIKSYDWTTAHTTIKQRHYTTHLNDNERRFLCGYETVRGKRDTAFELYIVALIVNFLGNKNKVLDLRDNATLDTHRRSNNAISVEN